MPSCLLMHGCASLVVHHLCLRGDYTELLHDLTSKCLVFTYGYASPCSGSVHRPRLPVWEQLLQSCCLSSVLRRLYRTSTWSDIEIPSCLLMDTLIVFRLGGQSKSACRLATTAGLLFTISALTGAVDTELQPHLTSETLSSCLHKCLWVQARCTVQGGWYESISLSVSVRA